MNERYYIKFRGVQLTMLQVQELLECLYTDRDTKYVDELLELWSRINIEEDNKQETDLLQRQLEQERIREEKSDD